MNPYRITRHLAILACVLGSVGVAQQAQAQSPEEVRQIVREEAASYGNGAQALAIMTCETGGTLNPRAIGDGGTSFGAAQLHRGGLLDSGPSSFYGRGFDDPFDITQTARYLSWALANGLRSHWHC